MHCVKQEGRLNYRQGRLYPEAFQKLRSDFYVLRRQSFNDAMEYNYSGCAGPGSVSQVNLEAKNKISLVSGEQSLC